MKASEEIDNLIAQNSDWRGATLSKLRKSILEVDPAITEEWKYMGSPVWEKGGAICIGNILKNKVQLVFGNGASLSDPKKLFNAGLEGKKWRYINIFEGDVVEEGAFKNLIREAITFNQAKGKKN